MSKVRFRTAEERALVAWAEARGWEVVGRNGSNHLDLRHGPTGRETRIPGKFPGKHHARRARGQLARAERGPDAP